MAARRQGFRQDGQGNVAMLVALCAMVLVIVVGGALDFGRVYSVRASLQAALDSASGSSAQWVVDNDMKRGSPALMAKVRSRLVVLSQGWIDANSNLPAGAAVVSAPRIQYTPPTLGGGALVVRVVVTVDVAVPTSFLRIVGMQNFIFSLSSEGIRT